MQCPVDDPTGSVVGDRADDESTGMSRDGFVQDLPAAIEWRDHRDEVIDP